MCTEENKALLRRVFDEAWNKGSLALIDEVAAADFDGHPLPGAPDFGCGPEGQKRLIGMFRAAFPDLQMVIEDVIAEGDMVVARYTSHGTHQGDFMGIPATGKHVTVTGMFIGLTVGGKFVEGWGNYDALGMMQQLGVVPSPGQAGA